MSDTVLFAPEGIPEGIKIVHTSGDWGPQQIRGTNIRRRRIALKMKQQKLVDKVGHQSLTLVYLKRIENGSADPSMELLQLIAEKLGCTLDDLNIRGWVPPREPK